ncbi:C4-dicarboxylate TRAP transporter substrate-binding protein [Azospirillum sp.]|uniref:C4-dicarboxylate TRAP transporter substrate-binding protein n=1 Tax=Azospirillum sp. TaxID=34012 RepID=UPI002D5260D4|nr:C4-dicarboxylate TRAP transporter substrate-binding protein [Azospirillum sp.]HYD69144.1 C4-dicarboxylate TRAP transporter substrate-binding protein [Azospirillum sp.]
MRITTLAATAALLAGLGAGIGAGTATARELTYGTHIPSSHVTVENALTPFFNAAAANSKGEVKFVPHYAGAVAQHKTVLTAARDGLIDVGFVTDLYAPQELPTSNLFSSLAAYGDDSRVMSGAINEMQLLNCPNCKKDVAAFDLVLLNVQSLPAQYVMCKPKVASAADIKGKRVRATGPWARMIATWGGVPVNLPITDTYEALERGQIDCAMGNIPFLKAYSLWDVAKNVLDVPLGAYFGAATVANAKVWTSLPPAARMAVEDLFPQYVADTTYAYYDEEASVRAEAQTRGVTFVPPSADMKEAVAKAKASARDDALTQAKRRKVEDAEAQVDAFLALVKKWEGIVAKAGTDRAAYRDALKTEVFAKVAR